MGTPSTPWVTCPNPAPSAVKRLFCLPYAGGGASVYRSWGKSLGSSIEVCPIQLPGREARLFEPSFDDITPLIEATLKHLTPYLDKPYAFYGHSMGALLAFELTRAIERKPNLLRPERIFLGAHRAAHLPRHRKPMHELSHQEFLAVLRDYGGFVDEIINNDEMMELLLPAIRADFKLCDTYRFEDRGQVSCPIHLLAGALDNKTTVESIQAWQQHSAATVDLEIIDGGHFFLNTHTPIVLGHISKKLKL